MTLRAYTGAAIFDGRHLHYRHAALVERGLFTEMVPEDHIPANASAIPLGGGTILPGFVDLQVNGGGGVMFNDRTSPEGIATISAAHRRTGTRAFLPTLITDTPERTHMAVKAVEQAIAQGVPGV
ncbi:N-acetylglucosamine-6-phosphate deacetylase, partial [Cribrihabitans sp. XS_ASV171]